MKDKRMKASLLILVFLGVVLFVSELTEKPVVEAGSSDNVSGYAWSDTIGWISFNCTDTSSCGSVDYGVNVNEDTGDLSGYAWSDTIGWVSFNGSDLSGCPSGTCEANLSDGKLTGWAKALSADNNGWDGFIRLHDSGDSPDYGVTASDGEFSGYAWGSDVVGWVDFNSEFGTVVFSDITPSVAINATPNPVEKGGDVIITWEVENVQSCTASGDWSGSKDSSDGSHQETVGPINSNSEFVLSCESVTGTEEVEVQVSVLDEDFSLLKLNNIELQLVASGGDSTETTITVDPVSGFDSTVQLSAESEIGGATYNFSDNELNNHEYENGSTFSVSVPDLIPEGTYPITVKGSSAGLERSVTVNLFVNRSFPSFEEF
ncbi:MAG: hypothetical protein WDZ90_01895 [Candidatus Paceibacterota bacterium]